MNKPKVLAVFGLVWNSIMLVAFLHQQILFGVMQNVFFNSLEILKALQSQDAVSLIIYKLVLLILIGLGIIFFELVIFFVFNHKLAKQFCRTTKLEPNFASRLGHKYYGYFNRYMLFSLVALLAWLIYTGVKLFLLFNAFAQEFKFDIRDMLAIDKLLLNRDLLNYIQLPNMFLESVLVYLRNSGLGDLFTAIRQSYLSLIRVGYWWQWLTVAWLILGFLINIVVLVLPDKAKVTAETAKDND